MHAANQSQTAVEPRVVIVGSGFSRQLSIEVGLDLPYPTISSFWEFANTEYAHNKSRIQGWNDFWRFYSILEQEIGSVPDVEQLLDMVELATQNKELLRVGEHAFEPTVIKSQLLFTITTTLVEPIQRRSASDRAFLRPVQEIWEKLGGESIDAIINFNWDVLLDRALFSLPDHLIRSHAVIPQRFIYDLPSCFVKLSPNDLQYSSINQSFESEERLLHLKLHGSLNWRRCPHGHIVIEEPRVADEIRCPVDRSRLDYFIIPPSTVKDYSELAISTIWKDAELRLTRARQVVIFGCSFRAADYASRNLLLTTFAKSAQGKEIIIVDEQPESVEKTIRALGGRKIANITRCRSWKDL